MPYQPKPCRVGPARQLLPLLLAMLAACSPSLTAPPGWRQPEPTVTTARHAHTVYFPTDVARLSAAESRRLDTFLQTLPHDRRLSVHVLGHADARANDAYNLELASRRAQAVAGLVRASGLEDVEIEAVSFGEAMPADERPGEPAWSRNRRVEVQVDSYEIVLPGCPNWSRDPAFDPGNLPLSNLGCANAVNLGLMVAEPADLAHGRGLGPADGTREAEAVQRYRTDKLKQLETELLQP